MSESKTKLSRRTLFAGAGTAGALAAAATVLPQLVKDEVPQQEGSKPPDNGGGYRLSEHVKRYYQTTLV